MRPLILIILLGLAANAEAQSQMFYCTNLSEMAVQMERDFKSTEFRPEHYTLQPELAKLTQQCINEKQDVKACVVRRCMEALS